MKILKRVSAVISAVEETLIVALMVFMVSLVFVNVVARKGFHASFSFTEELTIIAFVWVTMIGISAAYKRAAHLGMTFVVDKLPPKARSIFAAFSMVFSLVLIIILIVFGFKMVQGQILMHASTPALAIPAWIQGLSIPVGGFFMILRTVEASIPVIVDNWRSGSGKQKEVIAK